MYILHTMHVSIHTHTQVDYQSFVSFSDKDLSELGVSSPQDRRRMMTVIKTLSSPSSTSTIPEDQGTKFNDMILNAVDIH